MDLIRAHGFYVLFWLAMGAMAVLYCELRLR
jgi:hypothetical protein